MRHLAALAVVALVLLAGTPRAAAEPSPVTYRPPVDGPVVDRFRPSASGYGAGNLGVEYATRPGQAVVAAAAGEVVYAGQVGGSLHVVVLHADGVRTSYSFLATITVARGQRVAAGERVGTAAASVHFGARAGDAYLDPEVLLGTGPPRVRLVPDGPVRAAPEAAERSNVEKFLGLLGRARRTATGVAAGAVQQGARVGSDAVDWARQTAGDAVDVARAELAGRVEQLRLLVHYARALAMPVLVDELLVALRATAEWRRDQRNCTPQDEAAPTVTDHRIVVEVAGLGSRQDRNPSDPTAGGAVFRVDTAAIYADADVVRFSYRGGTTAERGYTSADTQVDIRTSGRRLRELLDRMQFEHPGVPIDIIAHSQGGLVVRSALGNELDWLDPRTPRIANVVTLGTPHHGANAATAGVLLGQTEVGAVGERIASKVKPAGIDPRSTSVRQLAETSSFIRKLNERPIPDGVRFTSIAARGDPVVPSPRAHLDGATNVIVDVPGVGTDHDQLPGSAVATREIALAVSGRGPTCESYLDALTDAEVGQLLSKAEDAAAVGLTLLAGSAGPRLPKVPAERTDP